MASRIRKLPLIIGLTLLATAAVAGRAPDYRHYPALGDRTAGTVGSTIEVANDKGLIVELTVRCGKGAGIITFSKVEKLYCSSRHKCGPNLINAVKDTCN